MAIAEWELDELPWPRTMLRVVEDDDQWLPVELVGPVAIPAAAPAAVRAQPVQPVLRPVSIPAVARRRQSAAVLRRRRAVALVVVVIGVISALALPIRALAGTTVTPHGTGTGAAGASVYVVQPGDTVWSIAERLDGTGDPRALAASIVRETGSNVVVPGERIAIP